MWQKILLQLLLLIPAFIGKGVGFLQKKRSTKRDLERAAIIETSVELTDHSDEIIQQLEIRQVRDLKRHPTRKWQRRSLDKIRLIVLHHTATDYQRSSWAGIATYATSPSADNHLSPEGAPYVPYHFGVDTGGVSQFNDLEDITWSVKGYNETSINISVLGDFSTAGTHIGVNQLQETHRVYVTLLVESLKKQFPKAEITSGSILRLKTHRDLGKWNCPGDELYDLAKQLETSL